MNFLNPFFLVGLISVAIPIVIHLINLRKPRNIPFSTLAFFEELKNSTIRRIRIKQYLLLALRVLAILMLALALARPFLPPSIGGSYSRDKAATIILMIDNSPSMNRIGSDGPFLDQAKNIARHIVDNSATQDRFIVTTTNGESGSMVLTGPSRAIDLIEEIKQSKAGNYIHERINGLDIQMRRIPVESAVLYFITDGQFSQIDDIVKAGDSSTDKLKELMIMQPVILGSIEQSNVAVSRMELKSQMLGRRNPVTLLVEVRNFGTSIASNHFVSVEVGERMIGQYEVNLDPGESKELLFEVIPQKAGDVDGKVVIEGDDVTYDNERYFVINVPEIRNVLLINEDQHSDSEFLSYLSPALEAAKQSNTQIQVSEKTVSTVEQSEWLQNDVIILDGLDQIPEYWFGDLQRFVQEGKGLLFLPSEQGDIRNYNSFMRLYNAGRFRDIRGEYGSFRPVARLGTLTEGHPVLDGLFQKEREESIQLNMPELFYYYQFEASSNAGTFEILRSDLDDNILTEKRFGDGKLLVSSIGADPGWSNFPVNALFAPLFYRSVLYASSSEQGGLVEQVLGNPFVWRGSMENHEIELKLNDIIYKPDVEGVPEGVRIRFNGKDWEPGILRITSDNKENLVAVNQDITESVFDALDMEKLENLEDKPLTINSVIEVNELSEQNLRDKLSSASFGKEIWSWFIWIALLLLVSESILSRLYKAETVS